MKTISFALGLTALKDLPLVQNWRKSRYERYFKGTSNYGLMGVFESFAEARAAIPPHQTQGFDSTPAAEMYDDRLDRIFPYDYPLLFWLRPLLKPGGRIFDVGGHIGIAFYGYSKYLEFPQGLEWLVCDVPAITMRGEALAKQRAVDRSLCFTNDLTRGDGCDIFVTAGAIQYVEAPTLGQMLKSMRTLPTHVLINKVPVHPQHGFVTLENIGTGYAPFYVFRRDSLLQEMNGIGYDLKDSWTNPDRRLHIPFHPDHCLKEYSGFYFVKR